MHGVELLDEAKEMECFLEDSPLEWQHEVNCSYAYVISSQ